MATELLEPRTETEDAALERKVAALNKTLRVLMDRVESREWIGASEGALLERNIALERKLARRTKDLTELNRRVQRESESRSVLVSLFRHALEPLPLKMTLQLMLESMLERAVLEPFDSGAIQLAAEDGTLTPLAFHTTEESTLPWRSTRTELDPAAPGPRVVEAEHLPYAHHLIPLRDADRSLGLLDLRRARHEPVDPTTSALLPAVADVLAQVIRRDRGLMPGPGRD